MTPELDSRRLPPAPPKKPAPKKPAPAAKAAPAPARPAAKRPNAAAAGGVQPAVRPKAGRGQSPNVRIIRKDGQVRAIEVVCTCGETIRLNCEYEDLNRRAQAAAKEKAS